VEVEVRGGPHDGAIYTIADGSATIVITVPPDPVPYYNAAPNPIDAVAHATISIPIRRDRTGRHYAIWPHGAS